MNKVIVVFLLFSFLGWIWESVFCTIVERKWANRGFLYGPICPIYGFGGITGLVAYMLIERGSIPDFSWSAIFLAGFVVSMILEYPTSWLLEKMFHARWWDYSSVPFNFNGRTSIPTSIAFGAAAILVMRVLIPGIIDVMDVFPEWLFNASTLVIVAFLSADITLTISALTDFEKRLNAANDAFQSHMTDAVYQVFNVQNRIYQKAAQRIKVFKHPSRKADIARKMREERFSKLITEYNESDEIQKMNEFVQHGDTTTLEHCKNVAWVSFIINERLHLNSDEKELIEAAMLHDFYLYDWHDGKPERKTHGFDHPFIANKNAEAYFHVSPKVSAAIKSHMWPLNITNIPSSREAILLCCVDKYCALVETMKKRKK